MDNKNLSVCTTCGSAVVFLEDNSIIRGYKFGNGKAFICSKYPTCDSYVGAHNDGTPLGTVANAKTRAARISAHNLFDQLWKEESPIKVFGSRGEAYLSLSKFMKLPKAETHIGWFDVKQCAQVVQFYKDKKEKVYGKNK